MAFKVPSKRSAEPSSSSFFATPPNRRRRSQPSHSSQAPPSPFRPPRGSARTHKPTLPPPPSHDSRYRSASASSYTAESTTRSSSVAPLPLPTSPSTHATIHERNEVDNDDGDDDDDAAEIIMAVDVRDRGTVGCASYVAREERLYFMEDVRVGASGTGAAAEVVAALRLGVDPTVVLVPTRVEDAVLERLGGGGGSDADFQLPYSLNERPSGEFSYEAGKNKLANLRLGEDDGVRRGEFMGDDGGGALEDIDAVQQRNLLRLAGWIDIENRVTVGCAAAVLSYLQRRRVSRYLPHDEAAKAFFRVSSVEMFTMKDMMFINTDTLASLQIMQAESHPQLHNQGPTKKSSGSKEGLSVYGLFHRFARTPQGKFLLRQYFLRPTIDISVLNARLDAVAVFVRPDNDAAVKELSKNMSQVKNIRVVLINLRKGVSAGTGKGVARGIWASIRQFVFRALKIRDAVQEIVGGDHLTVRDRVLEHFEGHNLAGIGRKINEVIDFEASDLANFTRVRPGIDPELDEMKRTYDGMEDLLTKLSHVISEQMPRHILSPLNVVFFPQIGFLISVERDQQTGAAAYDGGMDDPWERHFHTEDRVYFKSPETQEMDDRFGDIWSNICDREIDIVHELAEHILKDETLLTTASDICGELDSLLALAHGAKEYKFSRPRITKHNVIDIEGGRHPLQELTVPAFVPNDTHLVGNRNTDTRRRDRTSSVSSSSVVDEYTVTTTDSPDNGPRMLLMTGPNFSGKSVYLKQVALIVYMAHVGSFVPADSARIGLTDKILTRISTRETVSSIQSAFMIDLQQISLALRLATHRSLLVIDEFGKGTDATDGAALAAGVFEHLLVSSGPDAPKVLAATHFHEIFEHGFLSAQKNPALALAHMEVHIDRRSTAAVDDQIAYLYTLRPGRSVSSYGTLCARLNGVDEAIVNRAEELMLLEMRGGDLVAECATLPPAEAAELTEAERVARRFLAEGLDEVVDPAALLERILD